MSSVYVAEAIDPQSGDTVVVLALNRGDGTSECYPLTPKFAEALAGQLLHYATIVRGDSDEPRSPARRATPSPGSHHRTHARPGGDAGAHHGALGGLE